MRQYQIHTLEKRKDWPVIVTSVECPPPQQGGCGAGKGEFCRQVSTALGTLAQQSQRVDFHAARKYAAAKFLEDNPMPKKEPTHKMTTEGDPLPKRKRVPKTEAKT